MLFRSGRKSRVLPQGRERGSHSPPMATGRGGALSSCYTLVAIILSFCTTHAAYGADASFDVPAEHVPAEHPDWAFQVTPYIWGAGLDGHVSPFRRGPTIGIEKSFSDVLDNLDFGGFINVWGRYGRFVLSGDIMYVSTTDSRSTGPLPGIPIAGIPPGGSITAEVDTKQFSATAMGGYRAIDTPQFTLDALGGARVWHISNTARLTGRLGGMSASVSHGESFGWVDPLVGLRAFFPLTEKLSLQGQADIGGFGAGADLTWSVLATVNYVFSDRLSASIGYKVLDVDYDHSGHVYDTRLSGPVLGLTYRF